MPKYQKVQFVAWEIYTGPIHDMMGNAVDYAGITGINRERRLDVLSQCVDISARVAFTQNAINLAYNHADHSEEILKIFIAPEFLYRGSGGAYLHDLINGWLGDAPFPGLPEPYSRAWGGLFGGLQDLVEDDKFQDWIFLFGTAVSAAFQTHNGKIILEPLDGSSPAQCINAALIQCGGAAHRKRCYVAQKHLKSGIDFISLKMNAYTVHLDGTIDPFNPQILNLLDNMTVSEGGAVCAFPHIQHADGNLIKIGLEVCLDHVGYHGYGRLRKASQRVDIQLVPSGGMSLNVNSIQLLPMQGARLQSYAFNCDGLSSLDHTKYASHIQLWNQLEDDSCGQLVEVNNGADPNDVTHFPVVTTVAVHTNPPLHLGFDQNVILGEMLWQSIVPIDVTHPNLGPILLEQWPAGSGFIRVLDARVLNPIGPSVL